ncbi:MAG: hypothetical protein H3C31_03485 [Brumimicrobium sp.]|nr:hypothetical protein [Brumimicrobium sp.]MCO5267615.1 hypothetical protein [Brumimicrobium sp.]
MKPFIKIFILLCVTFFVVSCDPELQVTYSIRNNADKEVKLRYVKSYTDTIETIMQKDQTEKIYMIKKIGTPYMANKNDDSIYVFEYFSAQKDSLLWTKNVKDRSEWIFTETGKHSCKFELQIDNSDF